MCYNTQMKSFYKKIFILLIFLGLFGIVYNSLALELDWPVSPSGIQLNKDDPRDNASLEELVKYFYEWGILLGGLATFISLTRAGFQYLTSTGDSIKMGDARKDINSAIFGLILLLSSFLVLNTINPELTNLKMPIMEPYGSECLNCLKDHEADWETACKDLCNLVDVPGLPSSKGCDEIKFYNVSNPDLFDVDPVLRVDLLDELNYGNCLQPMVGGLDPSSGAVILYLDGEPVGSCDVVVELYDEGAMCEGTPMATFNYTVEDLSQLYLIESIEYIQIKQ